MLKNEYRYALMFFRDRRDALAQASVEVDWEPVREWAEFLALRRGALPPGAAGVTTTVLPVWHPKLGEPYVKGFGARVEADGAPASTAEFGSDFFKGFARQASAALVEGGLLGKGERFRYVVAAFPLPAKPQAPPAFKFTAEEVAQELTLRDVSLAALSGSSAAHGAAGPEDMPVFIPRAVLDEAAALSRDAGAKETGGVLIGHLCRDASAHEIFAEVTAQIHARRAVGELARLTFTHETWTEVRAALTLRRRGEVMLGWWHSHPLREWCKGCALEERPSCSMAADFFSAHDRALHRTVFPRAYSVGLVVNDLGEAGQTFSLFGWRRGLLEPRGFNVKGDGAEVLKNETREAVAERAAV